MSESAKQPPAGWYPDPAGSDGERFWDGGAWSQATRDKPAPKVLAPSPGAQGSQATHGAQAHAVGAAGQPAGGAYQYARQPQSAVHVAVQGGHPLASFGRRLGGYVIDFLLISLVNFLITSEIQSRSQAILSGYFAAVTESLVLTTQPMPRFPWAAMGDLTVVALIGIVLWSAYRALTVGLMNATLGQKILGMRVARLGDETLADVGWGAAVARGVWGGVLYQFIGFFAQISVLFTDRKQTVPDLLSKTVVVNTREDLR